MHAVLTAKLAVLFDFKLAAVGLLVPLRCIITIFALEQLKRMISLMTLFLT